MVTKTNDIDKGYKNFVKQLGAADQASVTVGVHDGAEPYENGADVSLVAAVHEFGTSVIPERAPIRNTWDREAEKWLKLTAKLKDMVYLGKISVHKALEQIGIKQTSAIKNTLSAYDKFGGPPSKKIEQGLKRQAKGGKLGQVMKTLFRTGKLRQSITYQVHDPVVK